MDNLFTNDFVSSSRIIYTPSQFARTSLTCLQECGTLRALKPHISSRADLPSYLFFMVTAGSGTLEYEGVRHELRKGDCVFLSCREGYEQSSSEDLWSLKWAHFNSGVMSSLWNKYRERGGTPVFHPKSPEAFEGILDGLYVTAASDSYVRDILINQKLTELLTLLMEETVYTGEREAVRGSGKKRADISEIKSYIDTHYQEDLSLDVLAGHFYLHKSYLARVFKETYGTTVNGYISLVRIGKAKELLRFTDKSVRQCGCESGFEDQNYFSRAFKKVEGCSPSRFRENWRSGTPNVRV